MMKQEDVYTKNVKGVCGVCVCSLYLQGCLIKEGDELYSQQHNNFFFKELWRFTEHKQQGHNPVTKWPSVNGKKIKLAVGFVLVSNHPQGCVTQQYKTQPSSSCTSNETQNECIISHYTCYLKQKYFLLDLKKIIPAN